MGTKSRKTLIVSSVSSKFSFLHGLKCSKCSKKFFILPLFLGGGNVCGVFVCFSVFVLEKLYSFQKFFNNVFEVGVFFSLKLVLDSF